MKTCIIQIKGAQVNVLYSFLSACWSCLGVIMFLETTFILIIVILYSFSLVSEQNTWFHKELKLCRNTSNHIKLLSSHQEGKMRLVSYKFLW